MTLCKNCQAEADRKFCPDCGQKTDTRRITTREMFSDLINKLLPWDRGFLYTVRRVLTVPGHMVREYLEGKRVRYNKPINFLFVVVAISLIFFSQEEFIREMNANSGSMPDPNSTEAMRKATEKVFSNINVLFLGMVPFLALASKWFNRKAGINYAEHLVANTYFMAGTSLVSIPYSAVVKVIGLHTATVTGIIYIQLAISILYIAWANVQFFRSGSPLRATLKAIAVFLCGYLMYILFIGIILSIVMIAYQLITRQGG